MQNLTGLFSPIENRAVKAFASAASVKPEQIIRAAIHAYLDNYIHVGRVHQEAGPLIRIDVDRAEQGLTLGLREFLFRHVADVAFAKGRPLTDREIRRAARGL